MTTDKPLDPVLRLDDSKGPIVMPEFEPPFKIYPDRNWAGFYVEGRIRISKDARPMACLMPLAEEAAMHLLAALDAYREKRGLQIPQGYLQRPN